MGATTVWERWNSVLPDGKISGISMNSMNHYAYGSIVEWMYRDMCGINPSEEQAGFRRIILAPKADKRMGHARAAVNSPAGRYESVWQWSGDGFAYDFTIPFNCEAELHLPGKLETLTVNGVPAAELGLSQQGDMVIGTLCAGTYHIC